MEAQELQRRLADLSIGKSVAECEFQLALGDREVEAEDFLVGLRIDWPQHLRHEAANLRHRNAPEQEASDEID